MALTYIDGIERELEQNNTDSAEFQDQYKERLKSLLTEIRDNYMAEMRHQPESARVHQYSQWDCVGLCLGMAVLESDLVTTTSDRLDITTPSRVSKIHDIQLLNPASGADMTKQTRGETLDELINTQLNVENLPVPQCHVFLEDSWTMVPCTTTGISPSTGGSGAALINCQCSVPGYTAVFLSPAALAAISTLSVIGGVGLLGLGATVLAGGSTLSLLLMINRL